MFKTTDRPPTDQTGHALTLRRAPAGQPILGLPTSTKLLGLNTHFCHGRTLPCQAPDCKACQESIPYRWHGYITYLDLKDRVHCLLELPAAATGNLVQWTDTHDSLRGSVIRISRQQKKSNGRVLSEIKARTETDILLPPEPDLIKALCTLWRIPYTTATPANNRDIHPDNPTQRHLLAQQIAIAADEIDKLLNKPENPQ
jgi:hypothetical protein